MKAFSIWLSITMTVFAGFGIAYHLYLTQNPRKILIAVDSSYEMGAVWSRIPDELERIGTQRYAQFCVITEKNKVHGWTSHPDIGKTIPYAPRDFSKLTGKDKPSEIEQAQKRYLITTAPQTRDFGGWEIIRPKP